MGKRYVRLEELDEKRRQKGKVIAVMNNKGGCGKTTTAMALGMYLVRTGHNVLFWDGDPQSNLTQRLGIEDHVKIPRLDSLFREPSKDKDISAIMEYPYLQRIPKTKYPPGNVGIVPGGHMSESEADFLEQRFNRFGRDYREQIGFTSTTHYVQYLFNHYLKFYDYIVMDTAPALEGNKLNTISVRTADEIVYPIDGIEAALGIRQILNWMDTQTKAREPRPNGLFAMVKYQIDTKNVDFSTDAKSRNTVFRIMKDVFGDFVCDNGVKELRSLRHSTKGIPGFGGKTQYTELCREIVQRITSPYRENIFEFTNRNGAIPQLEQELAVVAKHVRKRKPKRKQPQYREIPKKEVENKGSTDAAE